MVAGQLAITTTSDETVTVTLTEPELMITGPKGIDGTSTVYPVRGGLVVVAGRTVAFVR